MFVDPFPPHDELVAEISDVSDRPAEGSQPQLEKDAENLERRASTSAGGAGVSSWATSMRHA
jgi:hypothetical protein